MELASCTLAQTEHIADGFDRIGQDPVVIRDSAKRPLVVLVPNAISAEQAVDYAPPHTAPFTFDPRIASVLPYGEQSMRVYPAAWTRLVDSAVQSATGEPEARATRLGTHEASVRNLWSPEAAAYEVGDAGPHFDRPDAEDDYPPDELRDFNAWLALQGRCKAMFGLAPDFESLEQIRQDVLRAREQELSRLDIDTMLVSRCGELLLRGPHTDIIDLEPGTGVFFQAGRHQNRGLLPVFHYFVSMTEDRCRSIFSPSWAPADTVDPLRQTLIRQHDLASLGYTE